MEYWNLRTSLWGNSLFKHICLGENSNCLFSMIHFPIILCLRLCHVRRRKKQSVRLLRKGAAQATPGPHQPTLDLKSILVRDRKDPGSWQGTWRWGTGKAIQPDLNSLFPCTGFWLARPLPGDPCLRRWAWATPSTTPFPQLLRAGLLPSQRVENHPHLFLMPATLCWIECCRLPNIYTPPRCPFRHLTISVLIYLNIYLTADTMLSNSHAFSHLNLTARPWVRLLFPFHRRGAWGFEKLTC